MSLFKRPAWSQSVPVAGDSSDDDDDAEEESSGARLFSHSESFMSIMKDSERQKKVQEEKRLEREKRKQEKSIAQAGRKATAKRTSSGEDGETLGDGELKRRRITSEDSAALLGMIGIASPSMAKAQNKLQHMSESDDEAERGSADVVVLSDEQKRREGKGKATPVVASRANEGNLSDGEDVQFVSERPRRGRTIEDPTEEDSDPELAELSRKARARHLAQAQNGAAAVPDRVPTANASDRGHQDSARQLPALPDATIKIFINSPLEGTNPLIIYRKLSQRLQEVREVWCAKQSFSKEFADRVFLTHRGIRLYNLTTCRSLGLEADSSGRVTRTDDRTLEGVDSVHIEAMTQELFDKMKAAKALQAQGIEEETEEEETTAAAAEEGVPEIPPGEKYVRIVVRAKGHEDFKVLVKPETIIAKIAKAAKKTFKFPDDQAVYLEFDGEQLNPSDQVQETEIEDMNVLDLHFEG
jgi:hypothetical protein